MRIGGFENRPEHNMRTLIYTGESAKGLQNRMVVQYPNGEPSIEDNEITKTNPDSPQLKKNIKTVSHRLFRPSRD